MAQRIRFLVLYDVREPGRLRAVHRTVVDYGEMLQYSAYICDLTRMELARLRMALRKTMNLGQDSLSLRDRTDDWSGCDSG